MDQRITALTFLLVAMTMHQVTTHGTGSIQNYHGNPCHEVYENTTIITPQGTVICIVPSEDDLTEQLKSVGGYNKHYVARTQQEVNTDFKNLLPWDGAATTQHSGHPSFHKRLAKKTTRNSLPLKESFAGEDGIKSKRIKRSQHPSGIVSSTKVGCIVRGQAVGRRRLKQMCDICQRSSELDIDRFPRFINELTCETANGSPSDAGNKCWYSSFPLGTCIQGTTTIDLLKRTDQYTEVRPPSGRYFKAFKQIWVPYTQEIRSCCQCRY